jgi:hypothetical protein
MQIAWHDPATITHRTMSALFLAMGSVAVITVLYKTLAPRAKSGPNRSLRRWEKTYLIATVLLGWCAAVTGTFWEYPRHLTAESIALPSRGGEAKELVSWMAAIIITMFAYVLIRYKDQAEDRGHIKGIVAVFALVALSATTIANGIGGLIHR